MLFHRPRQLLVIPGPALPDDAARWRAGQDGGGRAALEGCVQSRCSERTCRDMYSFQISLVNSARDVSCLELFWLSKMEGNGEDAMIEGRGSNLPEERPLILPSVSVRSKQHTSWMKPRRLVSVESRWVRVRDERCGRCEFSLLDSPRILFEELASMASASYDIEGPAATAPRRGRCR